LINHFLLEGRRGLDPWVMKPGLFKPVYKPVTVRPFTRTITKQIPTYKLIGIKPTKPIKFKFPKTTSCPGSL